VALLVNHNILCPVLVGREAFVAALQERLRQAKEGQGQVLLLSGEAGIGKSRLVTEAKASARRGGFTVMQGNCFEPDRALPYAPILDLLRALIANRGATYLKPFAPELIKLLPELGALLPDVAPTPLFEPEQEKRRHFQTLAQCLLAAAGGDHAGSGEHVGSGERVGSPLQVVIEDLHWCDDTTLEFLLYLARRLANSPILLLLTYRSDETHPALLHFLAELERARLASEFNLDRLPAAKVEEMIRAIFEQAQPVRAEFAETIHSLTDGNPFFVEETLKALVASGDIYYANGAWTRKPIADLHIPRTVQDAVQRRARQLSDPARQLLTLAAVVGRRFDFALLQTVTSHTEAELLRLVKELRAAQLVMEESAEHFAFRHALTRQAVYAELLGRERRNLHRAIAVALEARQAENAIPNLPVGDLAYHCFEAGLWEQAFDYARRAADHAQALYTPRAAVEHLSRAIIASQHLSAALPLDLYRARGQQYQTLGDFDAAQNDYQTALEEAQARGDRHTEWQALIDLGFLWAARDYDRTGDYFRQALALAHHLDDSAALAHNLNRVGNWHLNVGQTREALRYHHEALRIFESLGDRPGLASTYDLLGITYYASNDVHQGIAHYEQAIALFRELGDRGGLASSLVIYASRGSEYIGGTAVPMRVSLAERLHASREALALARETGATPAETITSLWLGMNLNASGDDGGFNYIHKGLELAEAINHQHFRTVAHMILGMSYLDVLAPTPARDHLERALELARATNSAIWVGTVTAYLALAYSHLADPARAEATLETVLRPDTPMDTMGHCQLWAARAELCLAQGKPDEALQTVERLITSSPNVDIEGEHSNPRLSRLRGECLLALRRYATAERVLRGALDSAQALELRPQQWRAWASLSRLHHAQGKPELADEASAMASKIVDELAASLADAERREEFRSRAAAQWLGPMAASRRESAKRQFGGLTARERQVAALIAAGKSNLEIAEALTLSHRTVEAHISNILSKLGFNSRAQIAVWAVEKGLQKT
jgi:tetratricopeptide (TPR) repeat protein